MKIAALILPPISTPLVGRPYASVPFLAAYANQQGCPEISQINLNASFIKEILSVPTHDIDFSCVTSQIGEPWELITDLAIVKALREKFQNGELNNPIMLATAVRDPGVRDWIYKYVGVKSVANVDELLDQLQGRSLTFDLFINFYKSFFTLNEIPRLIGISIPFATQLIPALLLARTLKRLRSDSHIFIGGPVPTLLSDEQIHRILAETDVDSVIQHEGEAAFVTLYKLEAFNEDTLSTVPNLKFLKKGLLVSNSIRTSVRINATSPTYFDSTYIKDAVELPVFVGRGCYYQCSFCDYPQLYDLTSFRQVEDVVESARMALEQSTTGLLHFIYEVLPLKYIRLLCCAIERASLPIRWRGYQRVYSELTKEDVALMERSGCRRLDIGLESADDETLKRMNKGYGRNEIEKFFSCFEGSSIQLLVNIIVDYPGLTKEKALDAAAFLREVTQKLDNVHFELMRFCLTRNSEMHRHPERFGIRIGTENETLPLSPEFLALNQIPFEKLEEWMQEADIQEVEAEYKALNTEFRCRQIANTKHHFNKILQSCTPSDIHLCFKTDPFVTTEVSDSNETKILLRNLNTYETFLLESDIAPLLAIFLSFVARRVELSEFLEKTLDAFPDVTIGEHIDLVTTLGLVESVDYSNLRLESLEDEEIFV